MKFRVKNPMVSVPVAMFENLELPDSAVRLICWLLSHSGDFEIRRNDLKKRLGLGEHKARKAIVAAKKVGILATIEGRDAKGQITKHYEVITSSRFSTSGKTSHISNKETTELNDEELEFLNNYPGPKRNIEKPKNLQKFQNLFKVAVEKLGWEAVKAIAIEYRAEVKNRRRGGGIALPENKLWQKLNPDYGKVIDDEDNGAGSPA